MNFAESNAHIKTNLHGSFETVFFAPNYGNTKMRNKRKHMGAITYSRQEKILCTSHNALLQV